MRNNYTNRVHFRDKVENILRTFREFNELEEKQRKKRINMAKTKLKVDREYYEYLRKKCKYAEVAILINKSLPVYAYGQEIWVAPDCTYRSIKRKQFLIYFVRKWFLSKRFGLNENQIWPECNRNTIIYLFIYTRNVRFKIELQAMFSRKTFFVDINYRQADVLLRIINVDGNFRTLSFCLTDNITKTQILNSGRLVRRSNTRY